MRWPSAELYVCRCRDAETNCAAIDGEDFPPHRSTPPRDLGPNERVGLADRSQSVAGQSEYVQVTAAVVVSLSVVLNLGVVVSSDVVGNVVALGIAAGGC